MENLVVIRQSIRKNGEEDYLPWVFRCGCGIRARCKSFEIALNARRFHDCNDW